MEYLQDHVGMDESVEFLDSFFPNGRSKIDTLVLSRHIIEELNDNIGENNILKSSIAIILRELLHVKWLNETFQHEKEKLQSSLMVSIALSTYFELGLYNSS